MNSWWIHDKIVRKKRKKKTHEEIVEEKYALDSVKKKNTPKQPKPGCIHENFLEKSTMNL